MDGYQVGLIALVSLYVLVGISMYFLVQRSGRRFIIAGKRLPLFLIGTMLFAQALDANATLGNAGGVYAGGFWAGFQFPLGLALCLVVVAIWYAKPLNRMNLITLADFYFRRFGRRVEVPVGLLMSFSFCILVAGNLAGAAWIIHIVFGMQYFPALLIMSVLLLAYTFSGGLFSCAATDIVQLYPAFLAFVGGALWIFFSQSGGDWGFFAAAIPTGYADLSGLYSIENGALLNWAGILALGIGDVVALDFMERVFASKDPETARRGCLWGAGFTLILGLAASFIGLMAFQFLPEVDDPRSVIIMASLTAMPLVIGLFVMAGVIGAGLSTANGGALAVSAVFGRNILHRNILLPLHRRRAKKQGVSVEELAVDWHVLDRRLLWWARLMLIPVMAFSVWLAWIKPEPGIMLVLAFDVVFAGCLVPLTLGIYWKKANAYGALTAVIVGSLLRLVLFFSVGNPAFGIFYIPEHLAGLDTLIPPVVSLIVMVSVCLLTQKQDPPKHEVIFEAPSEEEVARAIRY
jgi:Na+/proline symporter